ncbi:MAG: hypothetical protein Q9191_003634 [Dirinaria sp. TL-2023a]
MLTPLAFPRARSNIQKALFSHPEPRENASTMSSMSAELAQRLSAVKAQQDQLDGKDKQVEKSNAERAASHNEDTGSQVIESGDVTPSKEGVWRKDRKDVNHQPPAGYREGKK